MSDWGSPLIQGCARIRDGLVLYLQHEIDLNGSPALRTAILDLLDRDQPRRLVIDLAGVPYMDSSGVAVLIEVLQRQRNTGGELVLCSLGQKVQGIFGIARLDKVFLIVEGPDQAACV